MVNGMEYDETFTLLLFAMALLALFMKSGKGVFIELVKLFLPEPLRTKLVLAQKRMENEAETKLGKASYSKTYGTRIAELVDYYDKEFPKLNQYLELDQMVWAVGPFERELMKEVVNVLEKKYSRIPTIVYWDVGCTSLMNVEDGKLRKNLNKLRGKGNGQVAK